jgi:hypothetical protein
MSVVFVLRVSALALLMASEPLLAQCSPADSLRHLRHSIDAIGSARSDSARLGALVGACWGNSSLVRANLASEWKPGTSSFQVTALEPVLAGTWNSSIPHSLNDGAMWAGRGLSTSMIAGARVQLPRIVLTIAPQLTRSENRSFPFIPAPPRDRSRFASPWFSGPISADLPTRFGTIPYRRVDAGESSAEIQLGAMLLGVTNASQWWGPGIRNALVMSNNAAGIPQGFVRTRRPISTRLGLIEGHLLLGGLTESPFFDENELNNLRSISAGVITIRPAVDTGLTLGVERAVYAVAGRARLSQLLPHALDVLIDWKQPGLGAEASADQLLGFFARWAFPGAGLAAHAEWARLRLPQGLREVLVEPQRTIGYTVGLEWARAFAESTHLRIQMEATMLEQTPPRVAVPYWSFYASPFVRAGYTQQGQVIGAAIGPGSSSQFIGATWLARGTELGWALGRVRWTDDAYYLQPSGFAYHSHDISLWTELTGRYDMRYVRLEAGFTRTYRMNYLFQTKNLYTVGTDFDVWNSTFNFRVTPRIGQLMP